MEFKCVDDKNTTPQSKSCVFTSNNNHDNHFKFLPNFSTPPSKISKIVNPFERRLINRLHLPTFSPSVFGTVSTPKSEEKFKWTIDDISSLKPADIDEATISQHVFEEDPLEESMVQQKIDEFFSEKVIVPSPMVHVARVPLVADNSENLFQSTETREVCESSTQTVLSLPPVLPAHIEEILKPYFLPIEDQRNVDNITDMKNTSLFKHLFDFEKDTLSSSEHESLHSISPISGKGTSPIKTPVEMNRRHSLPFEMDCSLSPIGRKSSPKGSRSACRLDFSSKMSLDASLVVPDIFNNRSNTSELLDFSQHIQPQLELSDSSVNWDMECRQVSFESPNGSSDSSKMDMSNSNTPHTKLFIGQRKRLSDSFKNEQVDFVKEKTTTDVKQGRKLFENELTDTGYHTESINLYEESKVEMQMFASTPTKIRN
ncbi:protein aurora borealis [Diorhabda sublineata]|uniref:protein aurora borealis n=1 Tax=Diorhabda sublineata TaxID=1163346 RepID=UPI0024E0F92D|nr:protein aurora borealis [Diorhabda sublineata]